VAMGSYLFSRLFKGEFKNIIQGEMEMRKFLIGALVMFLGPVVAIAGIVAGDRALNELRETDVDCRLEFTLTEDQLEAMEEYFRLFDEREDIEQNEASLKDDEYTVRYANNVVEIYNVYDPESPPECDAEEENRFNIMWDRVEETLDGFPAKVVSLEHTGDEGEEDWYAIIMIGGYLIDGTDMGCQSAAEIFYRVCEIPGMVLEVQSEGWFIPTSKNPMTLEWAKVLVGDTRISTMDILSKNSI